MATLYDLLPAEAKAQYRIDSLNPEAQQLLSTQVPASYPTDRALRLGAAIATRLPGLTMQARIARINAAHPDPAQPSRFPVGAPAGLYDRSAEVRVTPEGKFAPVTLEQRWAEAPGLYRMAATYADRFMRALPARDAIPTDGPAGPPTNLAERAAGVAGGVSGFATTAAVLSPVLGPLAIGGAAAAPAGTLKERAVRGVVAQAAGAAGEAAGGAISRSVGGVAGRAAATIPSAVAFGSAAPVAESAIMRADIPGIGLHGDRNYPMPTITDLVQGGLEMGAVNLLLGGRGILRGERRTSPAAAVETPQRLSLPAAPMPVSRRLPASTSGAEVIEMGPGASPGPPGPSPVSHQLPPGPAGPSGEPIAMPRRVDNAAWLTQRFPGAIEKLAPELAGDRRVLAGGRTVADLFRAAVAKRLAGVEPTTATRADVKAAVRGVLASGEMRGYQEIADAVNEPRGVRVSVADRQREARFSQELTRRAGGREVVVDTPGGPARATIVSIQSFRYPGVSDPVRAIVADPGTGELRVLRYGSVAELTQAVNSPQAMVKAEDVFARAERERARKVAPQPGTGQQAPVATEKPVAPPEPERPAARPVAAPAAPAKGRTAAPRPDLFAAPGESAARVAEQAKPEAPREAEKPVRQEQAKATPAKAAPAAERPRAEMDLPIRDATSAQRLAANLNRQNPDFEARVEVKRGRTVITVNKDVDESKFASRAAAPAPAERAPRPAPPAPPADLGGVGMEIGSPAGNGGAERGGRTAATGAGEPSPAGDLAGRETAIGARLERTARGSVLRATTIAQQTAGSTETVRRVASGLPHKIAAEHFGDEQAPRAVALPEYADEWVSAKKSHGKRLADTPENRHAYLRSVESNSVGSTVEARALLRYAAERAGGSVPDALPALRGIRWLEQYRAAEAAWKDEGIPEMFGGEKDEVEKILSTTPPAEVEAELAKVIGEPGPADDIPAGSLPNVPEGFAEEVGRTLNLESGKVNIDLLLPHLWMRVLRDIPRRLAAAIRNVPAKERSVRYVDGRGNVIAREEHGLFERDNYAESAWAKVLHYIARAEKPLREPGPERDVVDARGNVVGKAAHDVEEPNYWDESGLLRGWSRVAPALTPGDKVLTPNMRSAMYHSMSEQARWEGGWAMKWSAMLGDAARRLVPHSTESKMFADALEGTLSVEKLAPDLRDAVEKVRAFYSDYMNAVNDELVGAGRDPINTRFAGKYVGPHLVTGRVGEVMDRVFAEILGEKGVTPEVQEMRNRFLLERTGDPEYVRDSALQFLEYNRSMARMVSMLPFWNVARSELSEMALNRRSQGEAIVNWMKASLMRKRGPVGRLMDSANNYVMFARGGVGIREIAPTIAAKSGTMAEEQMDREGWKRAFLVRAGEKYRVGGGTRRVIDRKAGMATREAAESAAASLNKSNPEADAAVVKRGDQFFVSFRTDEQQQSLVIGKNKRGDDIVLTKGAHLFGDPEIRPWVAKAGRKSARTSVLRDLMAERAASKVGAQPGEFLNPTFTPEQHAKLREADWRWRVLRGNTNVVDAAFRAIGTMQMRSLLGYNMRSMLANSLQMYLTVAPELGVWRTTKAIGKTLARPQAHALADALERAGKIAPEHARAIRQGFPIGRRTAEMIGSLAGEVQRINELTAQQRSAVKAFADLVKPLTGFRIAEDFTRGVAINSAAYHADRLGYPPEVASSFAQPGTPEFYAEWKQRNQALLHTSRENLYATFEGETMFNYNLMGRLPIFGGSVGGLLGRLMTMPTQFIPRYVARPIGSAATVAGALARGGLDRATGGVANKFLRANRGEPSPYGRYPAPRGEFEKFLDDYGAHSHDLKGAGVAARQLYIMGAMAGVTALTGVSAMIVGTPGWQVLPLIGLQSLTPPGSKVNRTIGDLLDAFERSAIWDPSRGVEGTMSPTIRNIVAAAQNRTEAYRAARKAANRGKPWDVVKGFTGSAVGDALREQGYASAIPGLIALRRAFQQMPHAERFFETPGGRATAHLLGIKSYIRGNGIVETVKGTLGIRPVNEEEQHRVHVDRKSRPRGAPRMPRALSMLEPGGPAEALA